MGETFLVADFYHWIGDSFLHDCFKAVVDCAYKKCRVFVRKAAAWGNVSVGVNVEYVARALAVIFLEPAAGLPGAAVGARVGAGQVELCHPELVSGASSRC